MTDNIVDVVVVGAGISGLTAAFELVQKWPEVKVAILEAGDRIGGRTLSIPLKTKTGSDRWDVGGQWVGKSQTHVMDLLKHLNIDVYPQYRLGKNRGLFELDKGVISYGVDELPGSIISGIDLWNVLRKVQNMAEKVGPNQPFQDKNAKKWNEMSLKQFVADGAWTQEAKDQIDLICDSIMSCSSDKLSLLFFLMYINSAGSDLDKLLGDDSEGAQGFRICNGALSISEALHSRLPKSVQLHLSSPVVKIVQDQSHVTIQTGPGNRFQGGHVVMAIPPGQVPKIQFDPALSEAKVQLLEGMKPKGQGMKFVMTFEEAFWRQAGYTGNITCIPRPDPETGQTLPGLITVDGGTHNGNPALIGFADESEETRLEHRKELFLKQILKCFGEVSAQCIDYADHFWNDDVYIEGCVASAGPKVLTPDYPTLIRAPTGRVHWAGTETATIWMGYMSGAIQAGQRAAHEILKDTNSSGFDPNMLK